MHMRIAVFVTALFFGTALAQNKEPTPPDTAMLEDMLQCMGAGLPRDWKRAWVIVRQTGVEGDKREFEGNFLATNTGLENDRSGIRVCDQKKIIEGVLSLNANLPTVEQRRWKAATLTFHADGKFELKYDY